MSKLTKQGTTSNGIGFPSEFTCGSASVYASIGSQGRHDNLNTCRLMGSMLRAVAWECVSLVKLVFIIVDFVMLCGSSAGTAGSARWRRERWLRSLLRHERMTLRMELTGALHHSVSKCAGPEEGGRRALRAVRS